LAVVRRVAPLSERVEDYREFTIELAPTAPVLEILELHWPEMLNEGEYPEITGRFAQRSSKYEWVFQRVRDLDTPPPHEIVAETPMVWTAPGEYDIHIPPVPRVYPEEAGWYKPMPNRDWHLRFELVLYWWP